MYSQMGNDHLAIICIRIIGVTSNGSETVFRKTVDICRKANWFKDLKHFIIIDAIILKF